MNQAHSGPMAETLNAKPVPWALVLFALAIAASSLGAVGFIAYQFGLAHGEERGGIVTVTKACPAVPHFNPTCTRLEARDYVKTCGRKWL